MGYRSLKGSTRLLGVCVVFARLRALFTAWAILHCFPKVAFISAQAVKPTSGLFFERTA